MLTVLFVVVFLAASVGAISLHTEYHMARDYSPTLTQLRNL